MITNQYKTLKYYVYKYISAQVDQGLLKPGDRVSEAAIEKAMGLSRTPIREALIELASEGILVNEPRKGFRVNDLTEKRTRELYEIMGLLEGHIASSTAHLFTEEDFEIMKRLITEIEEAIDKRDLETYYESQNEFHQMFLSRCENTELLNTTARTRRLFLRRYFYLEDDFDSEKILRISNKQHREILKLLREGVPEKIKDYIQNVHWAKDGAIMSIINTIVENEEATP